MSEARLGLEILGSPFVLVCPDGRWRDFLGRLWAPFEIAPPDEGNAIFITPHVANWRVTCSWHNGTEQRDVWLVANEIRHLMVERAIAKADGLVAIHAAAVSYHDTGIVLCGDSGVGKTTLTLGLVDLGWAYMSDDVAVVSGDGALLPFRKPLGVKESERWIDFSHAWDGWSWPPPPEDLFLIPEDVMSRRAESAATASAIVLLARGRKGVEELSPARALTELWSYARPHDPAALKLLSGLCRQARCVRVTSDRPKDALKAVGRLMT